MGYHLNFQSIKIFKFKGSQYLERFFVIEGSKYFDRFYLIDISCRE